MGKKPAIIFLVILTIVIFSHGQNASAVGASTAVELARLKNEYSSAHLQPVRMDGQKGIAVIFEGTDDLHYYAKAETAAIKGLELKIKATSEVFNFSKAVFPKWRTFVDPLGTKVEVYAGNFIVFLPIESVKEVTQKPVSERIVVDVNITGLMCTSKVCLPPFEKILPVTIDFSQADSWKQISFAKAETTVAAVTAESNFSVGFALTLALIAGLMLNIMPCVWPVLPIIVMRIVEQAKQSRGKSIALGMVFCLGILLFFAALAVANIVLQLVYGTALQWGDQFRNPVFVTAMTLLLIVLALFMFGLFSINVPSSISSKSGSGKGFPGALGMGFLAAILSTPCSFGILASAFAWAQAQPLYLGTLAIMFIGIGMAAPYAVLTSMPSLLKRLPKSGKWMELVKQAIGFVLLIIAVKLLKAVPAVNKINVLYFAVVLSFCVWMWGGWVEYGTKLSRKFLVRIIAVALAVAAGFIFLSPTEKLIDWQDYDASVIESTLKENRPVLIKFTADWCLNCEAAEKIVYRRKDIAKLIEEKNVLAIKADTTVNDYPATAALKNVYHEPAIPVSILLLPEKAESVRFRGLSFAGDLKIQLEKLPNP